MCGNLHQPVFIKRAVLAESSVQVSAAERGSAFLDRERAVDPGLREDRTDAVADFPFFRVLAGSDDFTGAVGKGYGRKTRTNIRSR
jgi:hypothetical protein